MARWFAVAPNVRPHDRTFLICAVGAPPRLPASHQPQLVPVTPRSEGLPHGLALQTPGTHPWPPRGTMADLAYAPHALHAAQPATVLPHPSRLPGARFPPAADPGGRPPPLRLPPAPARLSGREWARFLRRLLRGTDALLVLVCVTAGFLVPFEGGSPSREASLTSTPPSSAESSA